MSRYDISQQNDKNNTTKIASQKTKSQYILFKSRIQRSSVFTSTTLVSLLIASNFHPQIIHLIITPLITMCVSLSTYLLNDIVDIKVDKINDPTRPLVSGQVSKSDAIILVTVLSAAALGLAYMINTTVLFLAIACLLVGSLYSVPKISLKDRFVIKTIAVAIGGFLGSMIGSSAINMFDERAIVSAVSFMVLIFVTSPINDLADYTGDKSNGRRTIPIVIGQKNTVLMAITIPFIIALTFWFFYEHWNFHVTAPIALTLLAFTSFFILFPIFSKTNDYKYVRKRHKKAVLLHYGLQIALIIGVLV
ncbi:MAG: UbiA prenyltransferase family protein [Thaumarchaeota archaeon]|nr:UbiA prenyltransferase family protein [Nitrososphaerota archaeon]